MNISRFFPANLGGGTLKAATVALAMASAIGAAAVNPQQIAFHNEATDTVKINNLLTKVIEARLPDANARMAFLGQEFIGTPYVAHTLEGDEELLRVNVDELDCTTFIETVAALAITAGEGRSSWRDFVYNLEQIRYRNGELDGYGSRLHYISDWIVNNSYRGLVREVTDEFEPATFAVKTIDFMSANRDKYPALKDSATFERIKAVEMGYRNHRHPYLRTRNVGDKNVLQMLRSGDILSLTSTLKNLDTTHMGMVLMRVGVAYLLHASLGGGRVMVSEEPLSDYLIRNRYFTGTRVIRLRD